MPGGILLTNETGANHDNKIDGNTVINNVLECGITLASHPSKVIPPSGPNSPPTFVPGGGVYNNQVTNNTSKGNGAAGVGIFASVPGTPRPARRAGRYHHSLDLAQLSKLHQIRREGPLGQRASSIQELAQGVYDYLENSYPFLTT